MTNAISKESSSVTGASLQGPAFTDEPPLLSEPEFTSQINIFLEQGVMHGYSKDYITGQISDVAKQNPKLAEKFSLSDQTIKAGVERIYSMGSGNMPLGLSQSTRFEIFSGVTERTADQIKSQRELSDDDKASMRNIRRDVIIGASVATGAAGLASQGVRALASKIFKTGMTVAATPKGQDVINDTMECVSSMIDGTPLSTTLKGTLCYGTVETFKVIKMNQE